MLLTEFFLFIMFMALIEDLDSVLPCLLLFCIVLKLLSNEVKGNKKIINDP